MERTKAIIVQAYKDGKLPLQEGIAALTALEVMELAIKTENSPVKEFVLKHMGTKIAEWFQKVS